MDYIASYYDTYHLGWMRRSNCVSRRGRETDGWLQLTTLHIRQPFRLLLLLLPITHHPSRECLVRRVVSILSGCSTTYLICSGILAHLFIHFCLISTETFHFRCMFLCWGVYDHMYYCTSIRCPSVPKYVKRQNLNPVLTGSNFALTCLNRHQTTR